MTNQVFGVRQVGSCLQLLPLPSCFANAVSRPPCPITGEQLLAAPFFPPAAPGNEQAFITQCQTIPVTPVSGSLAPLTITGCNNPAAWLIQTVPVNLSAVTVDLTAATPVTLSHHHMR